MDTQEEGTRGGRQRQRERDRDTERGAQRWGEGGRGQRPRGEGWRPRERRTETQREREGDRLRKDRQWWRGQGSRRGEDRDGQMRRHSVQLGHPQALAPGAPEACSPTGQPWPCPDMQASHCWPCGRHPGSPGLRRHLWASPWCAGHCPIRSPRLPRMHPPQPPMGGHTGVAHTGTRSP